MQEPSSSCSARPTTSRARKRTRPQREADLAEIGRLLVRGATQEEIAEKLATVRPYCLSRSMIRDDVALLLRRWRADGVSLLGSAVDVTLRKLDALEAECWEAWDKSKLAKTRTTLTRKNRGAKGTGAGDEIATVGEEIKSGVSVTSPGDPAFVGKILDILDQRARLLGLEAPSKHEHGGPGGGPIPIANANVPLSEEEQNALLQRHFLRMQEDGQLGQAAASAGDEG